MRSFTKDMVDAIIASSPITGSTNANGNLLTGLKSTDYDALSAQASNYICVPWTDSSNNIYVHVMSPNGNTASSVSVSVTLFYRKYRR